MGRDTGSGERNPDASGTPDGVPVEYQDTRPDPPEGGGWDDDDTGPDLITEDGGAGVAGGSSGGGGGTAATSGHPDASKRG